MNKTNNRLLEGLGHNDLKGLINDNVLIDLHKPKIGDEADTVVVAFQVTYEEPAKDLSQFIETGALEHLDVEVSTAPAQDGSWRVFVEFVRDHKLFDKVAALLHSVSLVTNKDDHPWTYRAFNVKKSVIFNEANFDRDIIDSRYEYRKMHSNKDAQEEPNNQLEESRKIRLKSKKTP
jgi:hypothetical protein